MCFFFSSRRRHTRFDCDWSSDVCSSDLQPRAVWRGVGRHESTESIPFRGRGFGRRREVAVLEAAAVEIGVRACLSARSEEHTSELQSQSNLVCRLLLEKTNQPCSTQHIL